MKNDAKNHLPPEKSLKILTCWFAVTSMDLTSNSNHRLKSAGLDALKEPWCFQVWAMGGESTSVSVCTFTLSIRCENCKHKYDFYLSQICSK